jgi:Fe-S-cluster-containing dehydrogenase component
MTTRRAFLNRVCKGAAALSVVLSFGHPRKAYAKKVEESATVRWGFLIDTQKCVGCGMCVKACKSENEIPYEANVTRTWVERYLLTKDGKIHADSPKGARDGFAGSKIDQGHLPAEDVKAEDVTKAFFVPKLCNQCANPPCVQVCPVGATYQTVDGVVLVDRSWCIGCGYCIMACPYGARFFHPKAHVADKCTFCYHRISKGLKPACVQACAFGARRIGNLKNPDDPVTKIIATERVTVLKEEFGTKPQAYYLSISKEVR